MRVGVRSWAYACAETGKVDGEAERAGGGGREGVRDAGRRRGAKCERRRPTHVFARIHTGEIREEQDMTETHARPRGGKTSR